MNATKIARINECLKLLRVGDRNAVVELHSLMGCSLYFIAFRYLKNKHDAEDLVQDFWMNIEKYANKAVYLTNGFAYLVRIIENSAKSKLRDRARNYKDIFAYNADLDTVEDPRASYFGSIRRKTLAESVRRAMSVLSEKEYLCINMIFFEERAANEVAKELKLTKAVFGAIKRKAISKMKEILTQDGWDKEDIE